LTLLLSIWENGSKKFAHILWSMGRMALKDTGLIQAKKQKGLSNVTTPKFHLPSRQNAAKKVVCCTLRTR
jgi:hypothetical protein